MLLLHCRTDLQTKYRAALELLVPGHQCKPSVRNPSHYNPRTKYRAALEPPVPGHPRKRQSAIRVNVIQVHICMLNMLRYRICRWFFDIALESISCGRDIARHFHRYRIRYRVIAGQLLSEKHRDFRNFWDSSHFPSMSYTHVSIRTSTFTYDIAISLVNYFLKNIVIFKTF